MMMKMKRKRKKEKQAVSRCQEKVTTRVRSAGSSSPGSRSAVRSR